MAIDDSSVFRHPELGIDVAREAPTPPTEFDKMHGGSRKVIFVGPAI